MSNFRFTRQVRLEPSKLAMNGLTVADGVTNTSTVFGLTGCNEAAFYINLTWVASTLLEVVLEVSPDDGSGTPNWYLQQTETLAAGVGTLTDYKSDKSVAAAKKYIVKFKNLNAYKGRLKVISTGGTTDTVSVTALLANSNA